MPRVLFLDLDETLVQQERAFDRAYRETAGWLAQQVGAQAELADLLADEIPRAAEAALLESEMAAAIRKYCFGGRDILWGQPGKTAYPEISRWVETFRETTWQKVLQKLDAGLDTNTGIRLSRELQHRFRTSMFSHLSLFPEVQDSLQKLLRHFRLAVITNGMETAQKEKISHLGLAPYFETVVASATVGEGKPGAQIFNSALDSMDITACQAVMVGDALQADILGAQSCGIRAIWLNRKPGVDGKQIPQVSGLVELHAYLGEQG